MSTTGKIPFCCNLGDYLFIYLINCYSNHVAQFYSNYESLCIAGHLLECGNAAGKCGDEHFAPYACRNTYSVMRRVCDQVFLLPPNYINLSDEKGFLERFIYVFIYYKYMQTSRQSKPIVLWRSPSLRYDSVVNLLWIGRELHFYKKILLDWQDGILQNYVLKLNSIWSPKETKGGLRSCDIPQKFLLSPKMFHYSHVAFD